MVTLQAATTQTTSRTFRKEGAATQGPPTPRIPSTRHIKSPKARNMRKAYLPIACIRWKTQATGTRGRICPPPRCEALWTNREQHPLGPTPLRKLGLTREANGQARESFSRCAKAELMSINGPTAQDLGSGGQGQRKLWIEKFPAVERICRNQLVRSMQVKGWPLDCRNSGPGTLPRTEKKIGQHNLDGTQGSSNPANIHIAARSKWVSLGAFIRRRMQEAETVESTAISATDKWVVGEKLL